jgi:glutamyl-tRNA synthetase
MRLSNRQYVGRLAPSPTGLLHLGHAATFWRASQRAAAAGGKLLLRIEDLDLQRSRAHFTDAILEDLAWLGIPWEPPAILQSQRHGLYREALDQLLHRGHIYPCRCSRKDLAGMLHAPHDDSRAVPHLDDEPVYPGICRPAGAPSSGVLEANVNYRFRVPEGETLRFDDGNLGPQAFTAGIDFGDFLVWRRDGLPSYQLACVVDDAASGVTEVVRGRDLLLSTARQLLLQRSLSLPTPSYFHTPLVTDASGLRLAKRHDALALRILRQSGLTPPEVIARFAPTHDICHIDR